MTAKVILQAIVISAILIMPQAALALQEAPRLTFTRQAERASVFAQVRAWLESLRAGVVRMHVRACNASALTNMKSTCERQRRAVQALAQEGTVTETAEIDEVERIMTTLRAQVSPNVIESSLCPDQARQVAACFDGLKSDIHSLRTGYRTIERF